jgi:hypothetical protein
VSLQNEIRAIEKAHRAAQARLGLSGAYLSLDQWRAVSANRPGQSSGPWLSRATRMIYVMRLKSTRLAKSYYQLVRALETGATLGAVDGIDKPTLKALRKQFLDALLAIATMDREASGTDDPDERWFESELQSADVNGKDENTRSVRLADTSLDPYIQELLDETGSDDKSVKVDAYDWGKDMSLAEVDREFATRLRKETVVNQTAKVKKITNAAEDAEAALRKIEKEHMLTGSRGAGIVDWAGIGSGRRLIEEAFMADRKAARYARGLGPAPCHFCSMLASRGWVYNSAETAGAQYHDNCHCYPLVRFSEKSELPPDNQFYVDLWKNEVQGTGGGDKAMRRQWRTVLKTNKYTP